MRASRHIPPLIRLRYSAGAAAARTRLRATSLTVLGRNEPDPGPAPHARHICARCTHEMRAAAVRAAGSSVFCGPGRDPTQDSLAWRPPLPPERAPLHTLRALLLASTSPLGEHCSERFLAEHAPCNPFRARVLSDPMHRQARRPQRLLATSPILGATVVHLVPPRALGAPLVLASQTVARGALASRLAPWRLQTSQRHRRRAPRPSTPSCVAWLRGAWSGDRLAIR